MLNFAPTKEISLRPYQADAIENLRNGIRAGKRRLLLVAGTGAGKTLTSAHLLQEADRKGSYALFIVDRVALVDQTSAVFDEYGIQHGIVQGINSRWTPRENVQVCSAQTLARRSLPRDPRGPRARRARRAARLRDMLAAPEVRGAVGDRRGRRSVGLPAGA